LIVYKGTNIYILLGMLIVTPLVERITFLLLPATKTSKKNTRKRQVKKNTDANPPSNRLRKDTEILATKLEDMSWREFERLCFLYFQANGYTPRETGEGADGGVDL